MFLRYEYIISRDAENTVARTVSLMYEIVGSTGDSMAMAYSLVRVVTEVETVPVQIAKKNDWFANYIQCDLTYIDGKKVWKKREGFYKNREKKEKWGDWCELNTPFEGVLLQEDFMHTAEKVVLGADDDWLVRLPPPRTLGY